MCAILPFMGIGAAVMGKAALVIFFSTFFFLVKKSNERAWLKGKHKKHVVFGCFLGVGILERP